MFYKVRSAPRKLTAGGKAKVAGLVLQFKFFDRLSGEPKIKGNTWEEKNNRNSFWVCCTTTFSFNTNWRM